jgi:hypothetical protein
MTGFDSLVPTILFAGLEGTRLREELMKHLEAKETLQFILEADFKKESLSPNTPTSPLFPDGLIIPDWIKNRKKPSVVVLFGALNDTKDPLNSSHVDMELSQLQQRILTVKYVNYFSFDKATF